MVDETMIGRYQHVAHIGISQLFDDQDEFIEGGSSRVKDAFFGVPFVAYCINPVVINIHHSMISEQRPALFSIHIQEFFRS